MSMLHAPCSSKCWKGVPVPISQDHTCFAVPPKVWAHAKRAKALDLDGNKRLHLQAGVLEAQGFLGYGFRFYE